LASDRKYVSKPRAAGRVAPARVRGVHVHAHEQVAPTRVGDPPAVAEGDERVGVTGEHHVDPARGERRLQRARDA
jgi:hypothetical protein